MHLGLIYGIGCGVSLFGTVAYDMYHIGAGTYKYSTAIWGRDNEDSAPILTLVGISLWPILLAVALFACPPYFIGTAVKNKRLAAIEKQKLLETPIDSL